MLSSANASSPEPPQQVFLDTSGTLVMQIRSIEALFALLAKWVRSKTGENNRDNKGNKTAVLIDQI